MRKSKFEQGGFFLATLYVDQNFTRRVGRRLIILVKFLILRVSYMLMKFEEEKKEYEDEIKQKN